MCHSQEAACRWRDRRVSHSGLDAPSFGTVMFGEFQLALLSSPSQLVNGAEFESVTRLLVPPPQPLFLPPPGPPGGAWSAGELSSGRCSPPPPSPS